MQAGSFGLSGSVCSTVSAYLGTNWWFHLVIFQMRQYSEGDREILLREAPSLMGPVVLLWGKGILNLSSPKHVPAA